MSSSHITSRHNPRVKDAVKLRTSRGRQQQGRIIVDGAREIVRGLQAGLRPIEAFVCADLCASEEGTQAVMAIKSSGAELLTVSPEVYAKLAFGDRDDGIVVVAETPQIPLSDLRLPERSLVAVVEGIEKPGNLGAILRTADGAGVDAVVVADGRTDLYNPNTIRASLGTVFRRNICRATSAEAVTWLRQRGTAIIAARPDAQICYTTAPLRGDVAIVLGSEATGLSDAWRGTDIIAVKLPMRGLADSLNVSTTAAVLFYEALRQREPGSC